MTDALAPRPLVETTLVEGRSLGAALLVAGGCGVVATSVLYAASPADVLPTPLLDVPAAMRGAVAGAARMRAAGSVGVASDIASVMGILLLLLERGPARPGAVTAGWAAMLASVLVFTLVDAMFAFVLVPLGTDPSVSQAFVGAKRLFDALFLVGTAAMGVGFVGIVAVVNGELDRRLGGGLRLAGAVVGILALVCAIGSLAGQPWQQGAGISILLGGALLAAMGAALRGGPAGSVEGARV